MSGRLQGRRVLITGATSGIGRAVALAAAHEGADLAICGLDAEGGQEVEEAIRKSGRCGFFRAFDLADLAATRSFVRQAIERLGGLDGVVNNAGANFFHGVLGCSEADIARCFSVDFYPAWAICQEAYPVLKSTGRGIVVNVASIHAERTTPGAFPYNAAKAALIALTRSLALEWGADGIRAVAIAPALIMTPLAERYFAQFADPGAEGARLAVQHPMRRAGTADEVAALVVFLLGDESRFITGTTIFVDGGISAQLAPP
ncbi:MAG TPA: SDR family oxidoreductase [Acetobacteraceae bacterium]|nr:SDR family oxidoreductase [Acetobacteraceae bacterium]